MKDRSKTSKPTSSPATRNATSSQALPAGPTPSTSQDGPETDPSGRDRAPASRSAWPGDKVWSTTPAICGPLFEDSSPSASLQLSLASRLVQRMDCDGSPEYALTWKASAMPSGPPICRLAASGRLIDGKGCSGWPTPNATDSTGAGSEGRGGGLNLQTAASLWAASERGSESLLNHRFSLWLMGYPGEWASCGERAMQSSRKSPRNS